MIMSTLKRDYSMTDVGLGALVGRKVLAASINAEKDLVALDTDKGKLFLSWVGDCCAHCYLAHMSGADALVGATITSAENAEWKTVSGERYDGEMTEAMGTNLRTDKGHITFESRVEHNGYYGGEIRVSEDAPMDQYHCEREDDARSPLADF
jgi:hypothetical protein